MNAFDPIRELVQGRPLPTPEQSPCRSRDGHFVEEWAYDMTSVFPKAVGLCCYCGGALLVQLPRQTRSGYPISPGWTGPGFDWQVEKAHAAGLLWALEVSAREALRPRGGLPVLPFQEERTTIFLARDALQEILRVAREDAERAMEIREQAVSLRERGVAQREEEASTDSALRLAEEVRNLKRARASILKDMAEPRRLIQLEREAARREPLPVPEGYVRPSIEQMAVLCDHPTPPEVVYALVDPSDPELVRYVGRTCDPVTRYNSHLVNGSAAVAGWVARIGVEGRWPAMLLLERCTAEAVVVREAYWIQHYRDRFQADLNAAIPKLRAVG